MKKRNLKSLRLNKKLVSNFNDKLGGLAASGNMMCLSHANCPTDSLVAACSNHMCDSRLGGCNSYYICHVDMQTPMEPNPAHAHVNNNG